MKRCCPYHITICSTKGDGQLSKQLYRHNENSYAVGAFLSEIVGFPVKYEKKKPKDIIEHETGDRVDGEVVDPISGAAYAYDVAVTSGAVKRTFDVKMKHYGPSYPEKRFMPIVIDSLGRLDDDAWIWLQSLGHCYQKKQTFMDRWKRVLSVTFQKNQAAVYRHWLMLAYNKTHKCDVAHMENVKRVVYKDGVNSRKPRVTANKNSRGMSTLKGRGGDPLKAKC